MKIAVVIPAYNEEKTIRDVLKVVKETEIIDEIIVVDDGSLDHTAEIARLEGVKVISLEKNVGKGGAVKAGFNSTDAKIIVLLDADLLNLSPRHINALLEPVIKDGADMTLGIFGNGRFRTDFAQKVAPTLTGQRAIKRELLEATAHLDIARFGVEKALTECAKTKKANVVLVKLDGVSHVTKEEKLGFWEGFKARVRMYWEILKAMH